MIAITHDFEGKYALYKEYLGWENKKPFPIQRIKIKDDGKVMIQGDGCCWVPLSGCLIGNLDELTDYYEMKVEEAKIKSLSFKYDCYEK